MLASSYNPLLVLLSLFVAILAAIPRWTWRDG